MLCMSRSKLTSEYIFQKQEYIPVGCVPSAAVAVFPGGVCSGGGGVWPAGCLLRGGICPEGCVSQHALGQTPPMDKMTDSVKT